MSMVVAGVGMGVAGVAGLAGSAIQAGAMGSAADKQAAASAYAADLQKQMFEEQRKDQTPWRTGGLSALYGKGGLFTAVPGSGIGSGVNPGGAPMTEEQMKQNYIAQMTQKYADAQKKGDYSMGSWLKGTDQAGMEYMAGQDWEKYGGRDRSLANQVNSYQVDPELTRSFGLDDFQKDPGYQFRMQQGQEALERSAAARGGLNSGGTLKAITEYGQNFASNEFQNAFNRFNSNQANRFNRLSALAGVGQTATNQLGQAAQSYGTNVGNIAVGNANAQGAAGIGQAQAWAGGISSIANAGQNWMMLSKMNQMGGPGIPGGGGGMSPVVPGYGTMIP